LFSQSGRGNANPVFPLMIGPPHSLHGCMCPFTAPAPLPDNHTRTIFSLLESSPSTDHVWFWLKLNRGPRGSAGRSPGGVERSATRGLFSFVSNSILHLCKLPWLHISPAAWIVSIGDGATWGRGTAGLNRGRARRCGGLDRARHA
jgi:hypothetical protein